MVASTLREVKPASTQSRYRPEIDGLRALAVVAVIINHIHKAALPSGYLGVDVFFVISGFVITSSLAGRRSANFADFITGFYTRRIKRLVPALVFFVVITGVLLCLFNPEPEASLTTAIAALFGLSNIYLFNQAVDYFAASTELNVFTHTWSLGVEEQFYLVFPLLVWFTGFSQSRQHGARHLFLATGGLAIASLIGFVHFYQVNQPAAYFLMPPRLWEMGAGCLLFLGLQRFQGLAQLIGRTPPLLVVAAICGVFFVPLQHAVAATMAVVALTALLIACLRSGTAAYAIFTHRRIVYIGLISYSLYLWHWGVISLSRWTIGLHWWSLPVQVGLMLVMAIASYRYIETPLRHADWAPLRWKTIVYGLLAAACCAGLFAALNRSDLSLYAGHRPSLIAEGVDSLQDSYTLEAASSRWQGQDCILAYNSEVGKTIPVESCTLGNFSEAETRVLVAGNSFSTAFTQAFDQLVLAEDYAVTITSSWGASPVGSVLNRSPYSDTNAYYWEQVFPSLTAQLQSGDWVFLISDMTRFAPEQRFPWDEQRLAELETGLRDLSSQLSRRGIQLAILHSVPFAREANCQPVTAAKQWFSPFGGPCQQPNREQSLARRSPLDALLKGLAAEGVLRVIDLFDVFCPGAECTYTAQNGALLYRDEYAHPSVEASRLSAPIIQEALTSP